MPVFAVRQQGSREVLEAIPARSVGELFWIVDHRFGAGDCEYAPLGAATPPVARRRPRLPRAAAEDWGLLSGEAVERLAAAAMPPAPAALPAEALSWSSVGALAPRAFEDLRRAPA